MEMIKSLNREADLVFLRNLIVSELAEKETRHRKVLPYRAI